MTSGPGEIEVGGRKVRYRQAGAGPLVVLLHSSSSHSGQWKPLIEALSPDFTVLAPDFHGYGRSDPLPGDGQPFFVHDMAAVAALIDAHGGRAHLVGHSLGGVVALRLALKMPEKVQSLTLIEPVQFSVLGDAPAEVRVEPAEVSSAVAAHLHFGNPSGAARAFIDFWVGPGAFEMLDPGTRGYIEATAGRIAEDWAGVTAAAPGQIALEDCAAINVPCLLIAGERTRASARLIAERLVGVIPGARLVTAKGASHMAAATAPQLVNPAITIFLKEVAG